MVDGDKKQRARNKPSAAGAPSSPEVIDGLAMLFSFAYTLPQIMGMGDHWPLGVDSSGKSPDAIELAKATDKALKTIPASSYKAFAKAFEKWAPWGSLMITASIITYPRLAETARLREEAKQNAGTENEQRGAQGPVLHFDRGSDPVGATSVAPPDDRISDAPPN